jgi:hypothetical protein
MKSPRNTGLLLMLATVLSVTAMAAPRANSQLSLASMVQPSAADPEASSMTMARKGCKFGQRYSSYHRRCVLWTPLDLG